MTGFPQFRPVAEHGLLVEFGDRLNEASHAAVLRLDRALAAQPFPGFAEAVPAYVNLLVRFDPLVIDHTGVENALRALLLAAPTATQTGALRSVDVVYDGADLAEVATRTGLTPDQVIATHLAGDYSVALYGFAPGYAYLWPAGPDPPATQGCGGARGSRRIGHHCCWPMHRHHPDHAHRLVDHRPFAHPDP